MILIYNTNNRTLTNIVSKEVTDLTLLESRLIEVLCNGKFNTWDEINNYVYKYESEYKGYFGYDAVQCLKFRLCKKIYLDITSKNKLGYRLLDTIYIDQKEI